jgi:hypothetical protein
METTKNRFENVKTQSKSGKNRRNKDVESEKRFVKLVGLKDTERFQFVREDS